MDESKLNSIRIPDLLKKKIFYISVTVMIVGAALNFMAQSYLHTYMIEGKKLPVLSDLILNNIPYLDIDYLYDIFSIVSFIIFCIYIVRKDTYYEIPYYLFLFGSFHALRALFFILTPFGNPPMFDGTDSPFNGFSNYELGVYPSGHTGVSYLYFLLAANRQFRVYLFLSFLVIVAALFLARGHYSIDILSGIFFAYAIKAFGDKHYREKILQY